MDDLYKLNLHEEWTNPNNMCMSAMRVPGGWVYSQVGHSTFVPYSDEFAPRPDELGAGEGEAL